MRPSAAHGGVNDDTSGKVFMRFMNKERIVQMQSQFDALTRNHPDAVVVEFWFARDLQEPLG